MPLGLTESPVLARGKGSKLRIRGISGSYGGYGLKNLGGSLLD